MMDAAGMTITESGSVVVTRQPSILIVDDSSLQRKIINSWLKDSYKVLEASTGTEALEVLSRDEVDLVLGDVQMPGMSGLELMNAMHANDKLSAIPILLMSAADLTPKSAELSVAGGGYDYLFKPLIKGLLTKKIETVLDAVRGKKHTEVLVTMMRQKQEEINELRSMLETEELRPAEEALVALRTPIQDITRSLTNVISDESLSEQTRESLEGVLRAITTADLYQPAFVQNPSSLDPVSDSFLRSDYKRSRRCAPTFPELVREDSIDGLVTWEFNQFNLSEEELLPLIKQMYASFGLIERFNIDTQKLEQFILAVRSSYKNNPYHCFRHAFDVTQSCYAILTSMNAAMYLTHLDLLAILTSALCHDIGHPGTNNAYQCATQSDLAIQYNDKSVLENFHCMTTFKMLRSPPKDFLSCLPQEEYAEIRKLIIECILHTDPAVHFESKAKLDQRIEAGNLSFDRTSQEDRLFIMKTIIGVADISNISKPWEVAKMWAKRVSEEFFAQGDLEREQDMPVAAFMDRNKSSEARTSANFIDFVGAPLFKTVAKIFPLMSCCLRYMKNNRERWEEVLSADQ